MKVARIILWLINGIEMNDIRAKYVLSDELIVLSEVLNVMGEVGDVHNSGNVGWCGFE